MSQTESDLIGILNDFTTKGKPIQPGSSLNDLGIRDSGGLALAINEKWHLKVYTSPDFPDDWTVTTLAKDIDGEVAAMAKGGN